MALPALPPQLWVGGEKREGWGGSLRPGCRPISGVWEDDSVILGGRCSRWGAGLEPDPAYCLGLEDLQMFQNTLLSFSPVAFTPCSHHTHRDVRVLIAL